MEKKTKSRDLDHLMEQNDTELSFLSAYGGVSNDVEDPKSILSAVKRFLKAGGVKFDEKKQRIEFQFGYAKCVDNGCKIYFKGSSLPLVKSDLMQNGFIDGKGYGNRWNYCRELTEEEFMEYSEEGHAKSE